MVTPDPTFPYDRLKEALLASHQLTDFQHVELLLSMEPLGARKPSELVADMWEICPPMQHNSIFFAALFLQRLPRKIRVLLTHEDHSDLRRHHQHTSGGDSGGYPAQREAVSRQEHTEEIAAAPTTATCRRWPRPSAGR